MCDMYHSYVFMCLTRLLQTCDMTYSNRYGILSSEPTFQNFSKVSSIFILHDILSCEPTFQNFHKCSATISFPSSTFLTTVSSQLNLLYKINIEPTFEKFVPVFHDGLIFLICHKFSKVSLLLYLLYDITIELTFEKFCPCTATLSFPSSTSLTKFSKVSLLLNLLCNFTIELTFEKFYQCPVTISFPPSTSA